MTDKLQINNVIEAVLEEHVAATRSQRVQIRELLLDAIEQAGFDIVGKDTSDRRQVLVNNIVTRNLTLSELIAEHRPTDYQKPDYCSEDGTR